MRMNGKSFFALSTYRNCMYMSLFAMKAFVYDKLRFIMLLYVEICMFGNWNFKAQFIIIPYMYTLLIYLNVFKFIFI